jgi:ribosomal protein L3 glutamine methyltransferase
MRKMRLIDELHSIRDFIRFAASQFNENALFYGHGTDNAWDEAVALILHTLHLPFDISPNLILDAKLTLAEREKLQHLIERRIKDRIPVPYLTHEAWFANLAFYVDERVLIPRSPIAELIQNHFGPWLSEDPLNILDLCTGSSCIAIACAKNFPESSVDATDISEDALSVAKMNVLRHQVENQVNLYHADLFAGLPEKTYDIIVSNPPYVDASDMAELPPEFHHEPKLGLEAGVDGLEIVSRILKNAKNYLNPNGILVVEVGNSEVALIEKFPDVPFTWLEFEHSDGGVFLLRKDELN